MLQGSASNLAQEQQGAPQRAQHLLLLRSGYLAVTGRYLHWKHGCHLVPHLDQAQFLEALAPGRLSPSGLRPILLTAAQVTRALGRRFRGPP